MEQIAPKRIFIVDDHQMIIDGINLMLEGRPEFVVVGESTKPLEVLEMPDLAKADILITDIGMPDMSGVELTRAVKNKFPNINVLALSMFVDSAVVTEMIDAGISGYVIKNTGKKELIEALTKVGQGHKYFAQELTMELMKSYKRGQEESKLTDREIEIIRMIEKDMTTRDIAETLFISERTVETHRKNILHKTNTQTVVGLLKYAYERKII
jgi:two-component system nitrate/nitrite response regulator NarL